MFMATRAFWLRVTFALAISPAFCPAQITGPDFYEGIAAANRFPMDSGKLAAYVKDGNMRQIRLHAWDVFQLLTEDSALGAGIPKWETWYDEYETFAPQDSPVNRVPLRHLLEPPAELQGVPGRRPASNLAAFVLYNREAYGHIRTHGLYLAQQLDCLKNHGVREIDDFPASSVVLKTSWMLVRQTACRAVPVWNFRRGIRGQPANLPGSWPAGDAVNVYPPSISCGGSDAIPLSRFYNFRIALNISDAQLKRIQNIDGLRKADRGDYVILVGFHFATHELPDWLWATFWWHNQPEKGTYAEDRPGSLKNVWRNYLMTVSYDMDEPREPDATPRIAYNPYLEGGLDDGLTSNCMTCHRRAAWPKRAPVTMRLSDNERVAEDPTGVVVRGRAAALATYFSADSRYEDLLKTGFLWSLMFHARTDGQQTNGTAAPDATGCRFPLPTPVQPR
jgi:hypothetical protein